MPRQLIRFSSDGDKLLLAFILYKVAKKLDLFVALLTVSWPPALRCDVAVCAFCEDFPVFISHPVLPMPDARLLA